LQRRKSKAKYKRYHQKTKQIKLCALKVRKTANIGNYGFRRIVWNATLNSKQVGQSKGRSTK
jgi:hypothetical protein